MLPDPSDAPDLAGWGQWQWPTLGQIDLSRG